MSIHADSVWRRKRPIKTCCVLVGSNRPKRRCIGCFLKSVFRNSSGISGLADFRRLLSERGPGGFRQMGNGPFSFCRCGCLLDVLPCRACLFRGCHGNDLLSRRRGRNPRCVLFPIRFITVVAVQLGAPGSAGHIRPVVLVKTRRVLEPVLFDT